MRGTKLLAWRQPPAAKVDDAANQPSGSMVPWAQRRLRQATRRALAAVAADVRAGLIETVGVRATRADGDRSSVVLGLPDGVDTARIATAIDLENVEAWTDENDRVHVAISPWYTTKDTDQVVLAITKVIHVLLGLHGYGAYAPEHEHVRMLRGVWRRVDTMYRTFMNERN